METETTQYLVTTCCHCQRQIKFRPSISMRMGVNSGHVACPGCHTSLHVEVLEGNQAACEPWPDYCKKIHTE